MRGLNVGALAVKSTINVQAYGLCIGLGVPLQYRRPHEYRVSHIELKFTVGTMAVELSIGYLPSIEQSYATVNCNHTLKAYALSLKYGNQSMVASSPARGHSKPRGRIRKIRRFHWCVMAVAKQQFSKTRGITLIFRFLFVILYINSLSILPAKRCNGSRHPHHRRNRTEKSSS